MARGLNRVQLIGHLGADPELRSTAGGQAVTTFRLAVNRTRRDQQRGQTVDETEWFRVVVRSDLTLCIRRSCQHRYVWADASAHRPLPPRNWASSGM